MEKAKQPNVEVYSSIMECLNGCAYLLVTTIKDGKIIERKPFDDFDKAEAYEAEMKKRYGVR